MVFSADNFDKQFCLIREITKWMEQSLRGFNRHTFLRSQWV